MARVSVEDCLNKMPNRFALVSVAAHRTRLLMEGSEALVRTKNKFAVTALREIAEGLIGTRDWEGYVKDKDGNISDTSVATIEEHGQPEGLEPTI